ncbi:S-layer family protein [Nostoc sp.]|uniref:S-layer family protein n=1 Tax=Nostoc sp. TaxID=1180 RepID=UPI002FFA84F5
MRAMSTMGYAYAFLSTLTTGFLSWALILPAILFWSRCAIAQVTSDGTTNTIVNPNGNNFTILNGIEKGNNLFHSFNNFSVPTGAWARFDLINTPNITTIFSRVTGGNVSNIDGLISTLNSSNPVSLFLINPAGIVFGANARLNIGGSFVGTTANSIKFSDGTEFSATNPGATPLLTISVPIGLQMGEVAGKITVRNTGHRLGPSRFSAPDRSKNPVGLSVSSNNTLALIGGEIGLDGGVLTASSGHIELGSVSTGTVNLNTALPAWSFDYTNVQQLGDIWFWHQALADASGATAGSIHLQGRNISLNEGSVALLVHQGNQDSGDIVVNASESLQLQGVGTYGFFNSFLQTDTIGNAAGGDLVVSAPRLLLQDGARISTQAFGTGVGGNISVDAADSIQLRGYSSVDTGLNSSIASITSGYGREKGGDIQVTTGRLSVEDGATLLTASIGSGNAGNSTINASELIEVIGESRFVPSSLLVTTLNRGNAGQLTINTPRLSVQDGGSVSTTTLGVGNAGSLQVSAPTGITVSGTGAFSGAPSRIGARAEILSPAFQKLFQLSGFPTGNSGNLIINTSRLQITDGAIVGVDHQGVGMAGDLRLHADTILLDAGSITASTPFSGANVGLGGNLELTVRDILLMRHNSLISAKSGGLGNGGNITLKSPIIVGLENSDIIANAVQGQGGNIKISTQGLFGLKFRDRLTPENDITASSEFGINGTVDINNFGIDPNSGLVELPENVTDPSQQIATGCAGSEGSRFVATGRGGIPQNPLQQVTSDVYDGLRLRTWSDIRDISAFRQTGEVTAQIPESPEVLVQATSWHRNAQGKIELVADKSPSYVQQRLTCAALRKI